MGRQFRHDLTKIDYTNEDRLRSTLKKVFPELDAEGLQRRFEFEIQYIGWTKIPNEDGIGIWTAPTL